MISKLRAYTDCNVTKPAIARGAAGLAARLAIVAAVAWPLAGGARQGPQGPLPYPQGAARDATAEFQAGPGLTVTRITSAPQGSQLSYYDINFYAPQADRFIYNTVVKVLRGPKNIKAEDAAAADGKDDEEDAPGGIAGGYPKEAVWGVASIKPDGTDGRLLLTRVPPGIAASRADMSADGRFVSYTRMNDAPETGWDLYGFFVGGGVKVEELRITRLDTPRSKTAKVKTSPAAYDPKTKKYLCLFTIADRMYVVYHDGTSPKSGGAGPALVGLTDNKDRPERQEHDTSFHRARLNPVFPNLIYYRRNGTMDNWVIDWTEPKPASILFNETTLSVHAIWTPDGTKIAGKEGPKGAGAWVERTVADREGRILPTAGYRTVEKRVVGPFGRGDAKYPGIFYASYSPDGSLIAVATDYRADPGGAIWLMNAQSGAPRFLCKARYLGPVAQGQPRLGFFRGREGLAFSTDNSAGSRRSKPPQIYVVNGF